MMMNSDNLVRVDWVLICNILTIQMIFVTYLRFCSLQAQERLEKLLFAFGDNQTEKGIIQEY